MEHAMLFIKVLSKRKRQLFFFGYKCGKEGNLFYYYLGLSLCLSLVWPLLAY